VAHDYESEDFYQECYEKYYEANVYSAVETFELERKHVTRVKELGHGAFGEVFLAKVKLNSGRTMECAVKQLKEGSKEEDRVQFLQEAAIMKKFDNPYVLRLIGVVTVSDPVLLCTEVMSNGSLDVYLRKHSSVKLSVLLQMAVDACRGMVYLSNASFVHRDLALRNLLLSGDMVTKIADFGLSRETEVDTGNEERAYYRMSGRGKIPVRWCAPESIWYKKFSTATDVWALGITIYEILTNGERPYGTWTNAQVLEEVTTRGYRLERPTRCPQSVYEDVMLASWHLDSAQRPTFSAMLAVLEREQRAAANGQLPDDGPHDYLDV